MSANADPIATRIRELETVLAVASGTYQKVASGEAMGDVAMLEEMIFTHVVLRNAYLILQMAGQATRN